MLKLDPNQDPAAGLRFADLAASWWRARWRLVGWIGGGGCLALAIAVLVWALGPSQQEERLGFRLLFQGVERGLYPNDLRFTPSDIVSEPVLRAVYERNQLSGQVEFSEFQKSFAVLASIEALQELREDFEPRLADTGLSQVDRARLEDEYRSRVEALRRGSFLLVARPSEKIPDLLGNVIDTWLEQAHAAGVFRFDLDLPSTNILVNVDPDRDDPFLLVQRLRGAIDRIEDGIERLETVPGAALARVGDTRISLPELKAELQDDLRVRLSLIETSVFGGGLYRNRALAEAYVTEQLFQLGRQASSLQVRADATVEALGQYVASGRNSQTVASNASVGGGPLAATGGTMISEVSETFFERLIELSSQQSDVDFRQGLARDSVDIRQALAAVESEQRLFRNIQDRLNESEGASQDGLGSAQARVTEESALLKRSLERVLTNLQQLYLEISRQGLEPVKAYEITMPYTLSSVRQWSLLRLLFVAGISWIGYSGFALLLIARRAGSRG